MRSVIQPLRAAVEGQVITESDAIYDNARAVFNAGIDRRPAAIVRCANEADIARCIEISREHGVALSIRGGGHNVAGLAVADAGIVADLSEFRGVTVSPDHRRVVVGGGVTWAEVDEATQVHGLATTGGIVSSTGVSGLTLGGGIGWLARSCGLAADNLASARLVTADGSVVTASQEENPDLFWALRGGGGNFGVVTSFTFGLHRVGPTVYGGAVVFPIDQARQVLRNYRDFTAREPDELSTYAAVTPGPGGTDVIAVSACYNGSPDEGQPVTEEIAGFGTPLANMLGPVRYVDHQKMLDSQYPHGSYHYWKASFLSNLSNQAIDTLIDRIGERPRSTCQMVI